MTDDTTNTTNELTLVECDRMLARVAQSWTWMTALLQPGTTVSVEALLADDERARRNALVLAERAERFGRVRDGRTVGTDLASRSTTRHATLAPSPTPARPAILDARALVRATITGACRLVATEAGAAFIGAAGSDDQAVGRMLVWLDRQLNPDPDAHGAVGLHGDAPGRLLQLLVDADDRARAIAGVRDEQRVVVDEPCPACKARSLQAELYAAGDEDRSYVMCTRPACRCTGKGCECDQRVRYQGSRHIWRRGEWQERRRQQPPAQQPTSQIRSSTDGHGGWPDRRTREAG